MLPKPLSEEELLKSLNLKWISLFIGYDSPTKSTKKSKIVAQQDQAKRVLKYVI